MRNDDTDEHLKEDLDPTPDDRTGGQRFSDWCLDILRTWAPAILVVMLIRSMIAEPFRIPSGSMVPTLAIGDHILVTKYTYGFRWPLTRIPISKMSVPERGDVIVFVFPGSADGKVKQYIDLPVPPFNTLDYVKRVVGLPGEEISVRNNVVHINGLPQQRTMLEPVEFVDDRCRKNATRAYTEDLDGLNHTVLNAASYGMRMGDYRPTTVPEGHVFVMGDNRDHSADSRVWGFVPIENIKGKARLVWLSYDKCERTIPVLGEIRSDRFGEPIK
jgi:signal peptidase I